MASTDFHIRLAVEGAQKGVSDLAAVDSQLNLVSSSAQRGAAAFTRFSNATSLAHMQRLKGIFLDTGIAINGASSQMENLISRMQGMTRENAFQQLAREANLSSLQVARLRASMGDTRGAFASLGTALANSRLAILAWGAALLYAGKACLDAQIQMQRLEQSYKAVFGAAASAQLQVVYEQADRVGLKFVETAEAAKSFFAAGQGTALSSSLNDIFRAVTDAGAALQLSTDDVSGAFMALGQMMSKGKVQAEELRGQLGERLPGAFQMAARAMNMSTAELDKFMADGRLTAEDLLPRLARALEEKYGKAAEAAADTVQGAINRMESEWTRFKASVLESGPVVFAVQFVTDFLKRRNDADARDTANAQIDAELERQGVKPAGRSTEYDGWGGSFETVYYTEQQRENVRIEKRQAAYLRQMEEEQARAEENANAAMRKALNDSLKGTTAYKAAELERQKTAALVDIRKGIESARTDGKTGSDTIAGLEADYKAAEAAWNARIRELQDKGGKSAATAARAASVAQADYTGELERTRQQVESLQQQLALDPAEKLATAKIHIEEQYQASLSKTREQLEKQVARGSLSQSQAHVLQAEKAKAAELERQLALREAQEKAEARATEHLEIRADFYRGLEALSGQYGASVEYQNQLIARQAEDWIKAGISAEDVAHRAELMQQEFARDPFSGLARGLRKFGADYGDMAAQVEGLTIQMGNTIANTLSNAFMTGKFSAQDFFSSLVGMAAQAASNAFIGQIFSGIGGMFGGGGGLDAISGGTSFWAQGGVLSGGNLSDYSNSVVSNPTFFSYGRHLAAFASGAGLMGEAGPEAIMPLTRMSGGDLGVKVDMGGYRWDWQALSPRISINVINQTGAQVEADAQATPDGQGGFSLDIILVEVEKGLTARARSGRSSFVGYMEKAYSLNRAGTLARSRR